MFSERCKKAWKKFSLTLRSSKKIKKKENKQYWQLRKQEKKKVLKKNDFSKNKEQKKERWRKKLTKLISKAKVKNDAWIKYIHKPIFILDTLLRQPE